MDQKLNNSIISSNYESVHRAPTSTTTHAGLSSTVATTTFMEATKNQSKLEQSICESIAPTETTKTKNNKENYSPATVKNK